MEKQPLGQFGWWWVVLTSIPFTVYSIPFVMGNFNMYKHLTMAALSGRNDIAGLHILDHVATWQVHSVAALAFMFTAPFQFKEGFRARHLNLHRRMGYIFVAASLILTITGSTTMAVNSEFNIPGKVFIAAMGPLQLLAAANAVVCVRQKKVQLHRRWMIRAAVMGYAVINSRIVLVVLQKGLGIPLSKAADLSIMISYAVNVMLSEFYIRRFLNAPKRAA